MTASASTHAVPVEVAPAPAVGAPGTSAGASLISVVIPAFNEAENLVEVVPELIDALSRKALEFEVVVVDDGSTDGTAGVIADLEDAEPRVRGVYLRRNLGKSPALVAGLEEAGGDLVVLMDADGQDDPEAVPRLLEALDGGLDLVTGRRLDRQDRLVKRSTSRLYNAVTARVTGVDGKDFNSGLKAMRAEVVPALALHGELHRYIPVLAHWAGYQVGEVDVAHRPRRHGTSKFGVARFWRGLLDLMTVKFLDTYTSRPLHLFGGTGIVLGLGGLAVLAWLVVDKLQGHNLGDRPALFAGILLVVVAVQLVSIGLLAELFVHARQPRPGPGPNRRPRPR